MQPLDAKTIGKHLKDARKRAGLTQAELAEAAGIVDETVSRIERGAFEPALSTVAALADALATSLDALAGRSAPSKVGRQGSPLVRGLAEQAALLEPASVLALLKIAKLLPARPQKLQAKRQTRT
jgi:transcriptional regulator with XRE-family HTH domain